MKPKLCSLDWQIIVTGQYGKEIVSCNILGFLQLFLNLNLFENFDGSKFIYYSSFYSEYGYIKDATGKCMRDNTVKLEICGNANMERLSEGDG